MVMLQDPEKCAICRRVRESFSPEILQAGVVEGVKGETKQRSIISEPVWPGGKALGL